MLKIDVDIKRIELLLRLHKSPIVWFFALLYKLEGSAKLNTKIMPIFYRLIYI